MVVAQLDGAARRHRGQRHHLQDRIRARLAGGDLRRSLADRLHLLPVRGGDVYAGRVAEPQGRRRHHGGQRAGAARGRRRCGVPGLPEDWRARGRRARHRDLHDPRGVRDCAQPGPQPLPATPAGRDAAPSVRFEGARTARGARLAGAHDQRGRQLPVRVRYHELVGIPADAAQRGLARGSCGSGDGAALDDRGGAAWRAGGAAPWWPRGRRARAGRAHVEAAVALRDGGAFQHGAHPLACRGPQALRHQLSELLARRQRCRNRRPPALHCACEQPGSAGVRRPWGWLVRRPSREHVGCRASRRERQWCDAGHPARCCRCDCR